MAMAGGGPAGSHAIPPKPLGNAALVGLFSQDDYPREALDQGEQGSVRVMIHVDSAGAVSSCEIALSSGFPALDTKTCEVIAQRAKFMPARDAQGRAVASELPQTVVWRLQETGMPNEAWATRITMTFGPDGRLASCRMTFEGAIGTTAQSQPCPPGVPPPGAVHPGLPGGASSLSFESRFTPGPPMSMALAPGDVLLSEASVSIAVDATGHVASCALIDAQGELASGPVCEGPLRTVFRPRVGPDGKPAPFTATMSVIVFSHVDKAKPSDAQKGRSKSIR